MIKQRYNNYTYNQLTDALHTCTKRHTQWNP